MLSHNDINSAAFKSLVKKGEIVLAGNRKLKIYGTLHCTSGKRLKVKNRMFFASEQEAIAAGYRPCGHCMKNVYQQWKVDNNKQI